MKLPQLITNIKTIIFFYYKFSEMKFANDSFI